MRASLSSRRAGLLAVTLAVVAAPLLVAADPVSKQPAAAPAVAAPPRLAVILVVDGLSMPRLLERRPWLKYGLKRLLDQGFVWSEARYRHLNTETAPGHASLSTGAPPAVTGIAGNLWYELKGDRMKAFWSIDQPAPEGVPGQPPLFYREIAKDRRLLVFAFKKELDSWERSGELGQATSRLGYGPGGETVVFDSTDAITLYNWRHGQPQESFPSTGTIPGPGNLRVPTLGDQLVAKSPGSRVVTLSGKDRSAMLLAGRDPRHAAYWYDRTSGRFTTSAAYDTYGLDGSYVQNVVNGFNRSRMGSRLPSRFGLLWKKLPDPDAPLPGLPDPRPTPVLDLTGYQLPQRGLLFDHPIALDSYFDAIYDTPAIDELVADLALTLIQDDKLALGRRNSSDLLAISFSAHDLTSHNYGNESEEALDALRRVDLQIERVLQALEQKVGRQNIALAFSADHGFAPIPESQRRLEPEIPGGRLVSSERTYPNFPRRLSRLLSEELCVPYDPDPRAQLVLTSDISWSLFYNRAVLPLRTVEGPCGPAGRMVDVPELDSGMEQAVKKGFSEEIQAVFLGSKRDSWPADDPLTEFARNAYDPQRGGDALLFPRERVLLHWDPARGSGHGTHHDYDTRVPVVFWGGPFSAGSSSDPAARPYDIAPTLAELLGVSLPDAIGKSRAPARAEAKQAR